MGDHKGEKDPLGLWTYGLVTCIGVGVTGTPKDHNHDSRFLLHFLASPATVKSQLNPFAADIKAAGLTNMEGWLSIPDTFSQTPANWNADNKKLADKMAEGIKGALTHIVGKAPKIVTHPMAPTVAHTLPHSTMQINKHNIIEIEGNKVTQ